MTVRINKYLAECGVSSRRGADELIKAGKVSVNGKLVTELGLQVDPDKDKLTVDGVAVAETEKGLALFYKPRNVVSTKSDPEGRPSIGDYLGKKYKSYFPVGRLDFESEGLVLLTNDGDLAQALLHPSFEVPKRYLVTLPGEGPDDEQLEQLATGIKLHDGDISVTVLGMKQVHSKAMGPATEMEVEITEGRNRILRRVFAHLGFDILRLERITHGPFTLQSLRAGEIKPLTQKEYLEAKRSVEGRLAAKP